MCPQDTHTECDLQGHEALKCILYSARIEGVTGACNSLQAHLLGHQLQAGACANHQQQRDGVSLVNTAPRNRYSVTQGVSFLQPPGQAVAPFDCTSNPWQSALLGGKELERSWYLLSISVCLPFMLTVPLPWATHVYS